MLALLFTASCQDHHWMAYDETDPLPEPGSPEALKQAERNRQAHTKASQLQLSAPAATPFKGTIVSGLVNLPAELAEKALSEWTLYIIARPLDGGAPLAAAKAESVKFPFNFRLNERNIMMGAPTKGMKLRIEAMLDSDGDPITKSPGDLFGRLEGDAILGTENVVITLRKKSS